MAFHENDMDIFLLRRDLRLLLAVLFVSLVLDFTPAASARDPHQMNHPPGAPPQAPFAGSGPNALGMVPKFDPDFWKAVLQNRVPAGTVLSGILEDDLSSSSNKAGDVFSIKLQDGLVLNGREVIPRNSKVVGRVVSAMPASSLRHGNAGRLQVSLQTLVTPDGRNLPFCGFISQNPNHLPKEEPTKRDQGQNFADYGQSVNSFLGSFTSGIGVVLKKRHQGLDFKVDKGEVLPIRLNRSLDLPAVAQAPTVPGLAPGAASQTVPAVAAPAAQAQATGTRQLVPGLVGPDPDAPLTSGASASAQPAEDANAIFQQPIRPRPLVDMPDPF